MGQVILMRCKADACEQGRKPCPCPQSCEVAESHNALFNWLEQPHIFWRFYVGAMVLALLVGTLAVLL